MHRSLLKLTTWLFFFSFSFALFYFVAFMEILLQLDRKYARFSFLVDVWLFFFKEGNLEPLRSELYHLHPKHKEQVSYKEKKKNNTNKLHGQFSYKPNENIVTRPFYSTRLSKTFNMIFSFCVCVLLCGIH